MRSKTKRCCRSCRRNSQVGKKEAKKVSAQNSEVVVISSLKKDSRWNTDFLKKEKSNHSISPKYSRISHSWPLVCRDKKCSRMIHLLKNSWLHAFHRLRLTQAGSSMAHLRSKREKKKKRQPCDKSQRKINRNMALRLTRDFQMARSVTYSKMYPRASCLTNLSWIVL